jgi:hypothetical protein
MRVGSRDIVGSGSIVTQAGDDTVELEHANLRFKFVFESVDGAQPSVLGTDQANVLTFTFTNIESSLGMQWSAVVAATGEKALHLAVYIFTIGEPKKKIRLINYTFSEEKS